MYVFPAGKTVFPCYSLTFWGLFRSLCRSLKDRPWRTQVQRTSSPVWCVFGVFLLLGTVCVTLEFYRAASTGEPGWKPLGSSQVAAHSGCLAVPPFWQSSWEPAWAAWGLREPQRPWLCGASGDKPCVIRPAAEPLCPAPGRTAEPQKYRTAELQNCRTTGLQNRRTTEPQNYGTAEPENCRIAELQNYRTTSPGGLRSEGTAGPGQARGGPGGSAGSAGSGSAVPSPARLGPVRPGPAGESGGARCWMGMRGAAGQARLGKFPSGM